MVISMLGPVAVDGDGISLAPRERVVLAVLAIHHGNIVSAEALADALWEHPPESWRKVVQGCVVRLRKRLGTEAIATTGQGYCLALPAEQIDAVRFERLLVRARELLMLGEPDRATYVVDEALQLWRGRPLPDLDNWDQGRIEAERLQELRLDAEELRIDACLQAGRYRDVLAEAQARVAEAPLREHRWALLAMTLYQAGRQGDALRTLHRARQTLVRELGLDPGPDIIALEDAILRQDPSLIAAHLPDASPVCPYRGLGSFDIGDSDSFFGRETEVSECLQHLTGNGVLAVLGPSGAGKSSLVRAGVCAALEKTGRKVVVVTPGAHPMDALDELLDSHSGFLLVVDQCEEAVMLCRDASERTQFFRTLAALTERKQLIIALRADRLGEVSTYPEFATVVERGLYLLKPMGEENLRVAIEEPARQSGLLLEPGLVDLLVRDAAGEPGSLPLLSHALRETWERREGNTLTVAGYRASGGIRGAVAQSAEYVYEQAPPEQRPLLRDLLLRLVAPSPHGEPVRTRVPRRVVAADPVHEEIIEKLVKARLVTRDEETVELAHEALARAWPRLRSWLEDDLEGQRIWRHLAIAAESWDSMERPNSELYRGSRLAQAVDWRGRTAPDLNDMERDFLESSEQLVNEEQLAIERQIRQQLRTNRRLRLLAGGVALLAVVATVVGFVALRQASRADTEAAAARSNELAASAISVMDDDPSLAKLLALTAATATDTPSIEAISALHQALTADLVTRRFGSTFDVGLFWVDLHPSGDRFVLSGTWPDTGAGSNVEVVDTRSSEILWSVDVGGDPRQPSAFVGSPFFTPDGQSLVAGVFWDPYNLLRIPVPFHEVDEPHPELLGAHIWDAETGELIDRYDLGRCGGLVVGMSEQHLLVKTLYGPADVVEACRWSDGRMGVELVDLTTRKQKVLTPGMESRLWGASMSGDGRRVAYDDGASGEIVVIDLPTGREVLRTDGRGVRDISQDGSLLLVGDIPMKVFDVGTGEVVAVFDGHRGESLFARFGTSGRTVFSTGADGILREWEATTGTEVFSYPGVGNGRPSFTDDGLILVGRPDRDTATLLDIRPRGEVGMVETCPGSVPADSLTIVNGIAALSLYCGDDASATTHLIDISGGDLLLTLPGQGEPLALSPDATQFVAQEVQGTRHGPLVVRETETGDALVTLGGLCTWDHSLPEPPAEQTGCQPFPNEPFSLSKSRVHWSPDGTMISGTVDRGIAVWDAYTGDLLHAETVDPRGQATVDLAFSPDSALLTVTSKWWMRTISTDTWETVEEGEIFADGGYQMGLAGYTPDGASLLAVGGFQANTASALHWYDAATLELTRSKITVHQGSIRGAALHPDGSKLATGASDGTVRIWDVVTGDLIHEITFGDTQIEGVGFVDDHRIAVTPRNGNIVIATIDPEELVATVQASLTRGFTLPECARFGFGNDCPTLAELRGPEPDSEDSNVVAGSYVVRWSAEDLATEMITYAADFLGTDVAPAVVDVLSEIAGWEADNYTATFADGRFDITRDDMEDTWCTGTYLIRDNRIWLNSERGWCIEVKLFDAGFRVKDNELQFDFTDFHGIWIHKIVFAARPLERVG